MKDLTTQQGRSEAISEIENSFLNTLRVSGFDIADDAVCIIDRSKIEFGIKSNKEGWLIDYQSVIDLYAERKGKGDVFYDRENEINFGASGSFNPNDKACYWRTVHAGEILKKWKTAIVIINEHCKAYAKLEKEMLDIFTKREE